MTVQELVVALRASRGFAHKRDIGNMLALLQSPSSAPVSAMSQAVALGDDCAAIADGESYLLFAIEGFVEEFVRKMPWFAGYCGVMVNVSDIYAMGGRPLAVVDALWGRNAGSASQVLRGMTAASERYGVPIVGGHSNNRSDSDQLAVAIVGRAQRLLTSFSAPAGDRLVMAVDLRGAYEEPYSYWNASTAAPAERLRADLELLAMFAEQGLCDTAKDISMAGALGTALMLLECSRAGALIDVDAIPRPPGVGNDDTLLRWLTAFPSYGFLLSVRPSLLDQILAHFHQRNIAAAAIGEVHRSSRVVLRYRNASAMLWDFAEHPFMMPARRAPEPVPYVCA